MSDAKLQVDVVFNADKQSAKQAMSELTGGATKATGATKTANANLTAMADNLTSIKRLDAMRFLHESLEQVSESLNKMKEDTKWLTASLKGMGTSIKTVFTNEKIDESLKGIKEKYDFSPMLARTAMTIGLIIKGLKEIKKWVWSIIKEVNKAMTSIAAQLATITAMLIAVVALGKNGLTRAKEIKNELAQAGKLGLDLTSYQEWQFVMESLGGTVEDLADSVKTLSSEQAILAEGLDGNRKAFEELGMSVADVVSMSQEELFAETVKRLQNVEDNVRKTQLAYQIFGEDTAARLTNVLSLNNEELERLSANFYALGGGVSDNLIQKSKDLTQGLQNLKTAWNGLKNTLAESILPVLIDFINWLVRAVVAVNMFIRSLFNLESVFGKVETANKGMENYKSTIDGAVDSANQLKRTLMGFDELNVVSNPNTADTSTATGGGGGGEGTSLLGNLDIDTAAIQEKVDKLKKTITPTLLILVGLAGVLLSLIGGNWAAAIFFAGIAGIGIVAGIETGLFDNWKLQMNEVIGLAITAIGIMAIVVGLLTGRWGMIIGGIAIAGIGLAVGGADGINSICENFKHEITMITAIAMAAIGIVGAIVALLMGNIPMAIALGAVGIAGLVGLGMESGFFGKCKEWFNEFVDFFKRIFNKIGEVISQAWQKIKDFFGKIGDGIRNIIDGVKDFFSFGDGSVNYSINGTSPRVAMATGGIVSRATPALVGEAGREAVLPLENNTGWMDILADRIIAKQNTPSKIVLQVGEKELGWATINGINKITEQTGQVQLVV